MSRVTEVTFECPVDEIAVLDGYRQAHGLSRTTVLRDILREWSAIRRREAMMILRVAGDHPEPSDPDREDG